jgi:hypothetical protein
MLNSLDPIHVRHVDIGKNQLHTLGFQLLQGLHAVTGFQDLSQRESLPEHSLENLPNRGGIIHNQYVYSHSLSLRGTRVISDRSSEALARIDSAALVRRPYIDRAISTEFQPGL